MAEPVINKEKCTGCNACCEICPMEILKLENNVCICTNPKECIGCHACEAQCPTDAIKVKD
ncbi:4Fe-4S binding protein [Candidatus Woesearchaeota archaeon]|nr:4Fe-4S binding protein [Candidatus Woesearchaeota archaeon]MBW3013984.1 4Fe-4S binding protein [Candidatus Woesearchaeota archaeon]